MNWNSASEFFAMGGYGLYVWGSYGVALVVMLIEPWLAAQRTRRARSEVADRLQQEH
jgi:heme exporter protein D